MDKLQTAAPSDDDDDNTALDSDLLGWNIFYRWENFLSSGTSTDCLGLARDNESSSANHLLSPFCMCLTDWCG